MKEIQKEINFQCPICKQHHKIKISVDELKQAKFQLKLVQKAYGHEDFGQVIILHIDWESRIRRITAYNFLENLKLSKNNESDLNKTFLEKIPYETNRKLPSTEDLNKKTAIDMVKPWKTGLIKESQMSLDKLIHSMVKSSKQKKTT
ncbi:MAG: hypothetical protein ACW981_20135 [Candidatus Hodarchaeales archaeon]